MPKSQVSEKQLAANRANAARSTGPRTPEGKSRSSQNARKHGFTASAFSIIRVEDLDEVARLRADLIACYQPVNSQELFALERMAIAQQTLLRAARLESGMFTAALDHALDFTRQPIVPMTPELAGGDIEVTRQQNRNYALAEGFHRMTQKSNAWQLFLRYKDQAERHYRRAKEEFEALKKLRSELPNEPIVDSQPEEKEAPSAAPNEPVSEPVQTAPARLSIVSPRGPEASAHPAGPESDPPGETPPQIRAREQAVEEL